VAQDPILNEIYLPIEASVEVGASAQQQICPTAGVGCVAIFKSKGRDDHSVYRGQ
jgi:hypothetical protein